MVDPAGKLVSVNEVPPGLAIADPVAGHVTPVAGDVLQALMLQPVNPLAGVSVKMAPLALAGPLFLTTIV